MLFRATLSVCEELGRRIKSQTKLGSAVRPCLWKVSSWEASKIGRSERRWSGVPLLQTGESDYLLAAFLFFLPLVTSWGLVNVCVCWMVVTHGSFWQESNSSQPLSHDGGFFNRLEDDVHKILVREKRREQLTEHNGTDNCPAPEHNQACKYHSLKSTVSFLVHFKGSKPQLQF